MNCPHCDVALLLAPPDVTVPTYPTCSDIKPVAERRCPRCGNSFVLMPDGPRRAATVLAEVLHARALLAGDGGAA